MATAEKSNAKDIGPGESAIGEGCELPLDFNIGSDVFCDDGRCGRLARVVLDPATDSVTHLIVEKGFLQKKDRVVPVADVTGAAGDAIYLKIPSSEIATLPEYREIEFRVPARGWDGGRYKPEDARYWMTGYSGINEAAVTPSRRQRLHEGVPFEMKVVGNGTPVRDAEGVIGEVDHVLVDCEKAHITHVVVRRGLFRDYRIIPVDLFKRVDEQGIYLSVRREEVNGAPRYVPRNR